MDKGEHRENLCSFFLVICSSFSDVKQDTETFTVLHGSCPVIFNRWLTCISIKWPYVHDLVVFLLLELKFNMLLMFFFTVQCCRAQHEGFLYIYQHK